MQIDFDPSSKAVKPSTEMQNFSINVTETQETTSLFDVAKSGLVNLNAEAKITDQKVLAASQDPTNPENLLVLHAETNKKGLQINVISKVVGVLTGAIKNLLQTQ